MRWREQPVQEPRGRKLLVCLQNCREASGAGVVKKGLVGDEVGVAQVGQCKHVGI